MRTLAWILIYLNALGVLLIPLLIGKARTGVYSYSDFISRIIGAAIVIPLCGRVLGWW